MSLILLNFGLGSGIRMTETENRPATPMTCSPLVISRSFSWRNRIWLGENNSSWNATGRFCHGLDSPSDVAGHRMPTSADRGLCLVTIRCQALRMGLEEPRSRVRHPNDGDREAGRSGSCFDKLSKKIYNVFLTFAHQFWAQNFPPKSEKNPYIAKSLLSMFVVSKFWILSLEYVLRHERQRHVFGRCVSCFIIFTVDPTMTIASSSISWSAQSPSNSFSNKELIHTFRHTFLGSVTCPGFHISGNIWVQVHTMRSVLRNIAQPSIEYREFSV